MRNLDLIFEEIESQLGRAMIDARRQDFEKSLHRIQLALFMQSEILKALIGDIANILPSEFSKRITENERF